MCYACPKEQSSKWRGALPVMNSDDDRSESATVPTVTQNSCRLAFFNVKFVVKACKQKSVACLEIKVCIFLK